MAEKIQEINRNLDKNNQTVKTNKVNSINSKQKFD